MPLNFARKARKQVEADAEEASVPVTAQFFDTFLGTSIAELYVHSGSLVCVTRSQMYLLRLDRERQLQWRNVFDCAHDLDAEGKLRKIKYSAAHASVYATLYQAKTPKVLVRVDLKAESEERMFFTHKLPPDASDFAVDPTSANKAWAIRGNQVECLELRERNFQLVENERAQEPRARVLECAKSQVEGLVFGRGGEACFVYEQNTIKKYSTAKNELLFALEGHTFEIEKLVFSADMGFVVR